ncbi:MAG: hypothetical protein F6J86_32600 [Symploca sp. SIO1B1]|nr:hypothetical protein [Symploca sp. SIO1A3]NER98512.1 hypothetical protein [Symploca sp. SIO1B1]
MPSLVARLFREKQPQVRLSQLNQLAAQKLLILIQFQIFFSKNSPATLA